MSRAACEQVGLGINPTYSTYALCMLRQNNSDVFEKCGSFGIILAPVISYDSQIYFKKTQEDEKREGGRSRALWVVECSIYQRIMKDTAK